MGHTRSSNLAFKSLVILALLICATISEKAAPKKKGSPSEKPAKKAQPKKAQPKKEQPKTEQPPKAEVPKEEQKLVPTPFATELVIETLMKPKECPRLTKKRDVLSIHYTGSLAGTNIIFDESRAVSEKPFVFQLGAKSVIDGWELGLKGMCVKEVRKLTVPPHLAYGDRNLTAVPPNSTLIYVIELFDIKDGVKVPNIFKLIDTDKDHRLSKEEMKVYLDREVLSLGVLPDGNERMVEELYKVDDRNGDGYLSHDEFSGPKEDDDEEHDEL